MRQKLFFIITIGLFINTSMCYCSNFDVVTWKGVYYHATPNKPGISAQYCKQHSPGTFIHVVKSALVHSLVTNKGITLHHPKFHIKNVNGVYLIEGSWLATGKTNNQEWQDNIHYYFYKLTDLGVTRGVWASKECKGLYMGKVIKPH